MKILLVGAVKNIRDTRIQLLASNGFEVLGVEPDQAQQYLGDTTFECLILGASLGEAQAAQLGYDFTCTNGRYVIRVAEHPIALDYPYAAIVVHPGNPNALLAAVKAVCIRCNNAF